MKMKIIVPIMILMAIFIASVGSSTAQLIIVQPIGSGESAIGLGESAIGFLDSAIGFGDVLGQEQLGEVQVGEVPSVGCVRTNASTCT